jgi:hypothetical protein
MDKNTSMVMGLVFGAMIVVVGLYYSSEVSVVASTELDSIRLYKGDIFKARHFSGDYIISVYYVLTDANPLSETCTIRMSFFDTASTISCVKGSEIMIGDKHYTVGAITLNFVDLVEVK